MARKTDGMRCRHAKDVFHAWMVEGAAFMGDYDIPLISAVDACPERIVAFSDAMDAAKPDLAAFVHFFEDDFRFERLWNNPKVYLARLSSYGGVFMPDFSTCVDFPRAMKIWNTYRNFTIASWLQRESITVVPVLRCEPGSDEYSLAPIEKGGTAAVCLRSEVKRKDDRRRLERDFRHSVDYCQPKRILAYGSDPYGILDYARDKGIEVVRYPSKGRGRLGGGR